MRNFYRNRLCVLLLNLVRSSTCCTWTHHKDNIACCHKKLFISATCFEVTDQLTPGLQRLSELLGSTVMFWLTWNKLLSQLGFWPWTSSWKSFLFPSYELSKRGAFSFDARLSWTELYFNKRNHNLKTALCIYSGCLTWKCVCWSETFRWWKKEA